MTRVGEDADVLGTIPGISQNGEYVYFVANGVLAAGAQPGTVPAPDRYSRTLRHSATCTSQNPIPKIPAQRQTRLIARLSDEDAGDWAGANSPAARATSGASPAAVSPNGRYLAFMSDQPLTGYDNVDADPEAGGARDEEVFLYDARSGRLVCASCNPSGEPPHRGVSTPKRPAKALGWWSIVPKPGPGTGWRDRSRAGRCSSSTTPAPSTNRAISPTVAGCSSTAPTPLVPQVQDRSRPGDRRRHTLQRRRRERLRVRAYRRRTCTSQPGCVSLISSGTSPHESALPRRQRKRR